MVWVGGWWCWGCMHANPWAETGRGLGAPVRLPWRQLMWHSEQQGCLSRAHPDPSSPLRDCPVLLLQALVYHQLTNLIRDTVWLKSYLSGG